MTDGDGHIKIVVKKPYKQRNGNMSSERTDILIKLCGSEGAMNSFKEFVVKFEPSLNASVTRYKSIFVFRFTGEKARNIINVLYNNPGIALERKLQTAKEIAIATIGIQR
jgi:hypothetical protein